MACGSLHLSPLARGWSTTLLAALSPAAPAWCRGGILWYRMCISTAGGTPMAPHHPCSTKEGDHGHHPSDHIRSPPGPGAVAGDPVGISGYRRGGGATAR